MGEETFSLTQVNEHSRGLLPSLSVPHGVTERKKDVWSSRSLNKSVTSSTSRIQDRLYQVQDEVRTTFDTLYSSRRDLLLPKVMEMERTDSVRDQLQALEGKVVLKLKTYNALHSKRKMKQELLSQFQQELTRLLNRENDLSSVQSKAQGIDQKFKKALELVEMEEDYTDVLEHMIGETANSKLRLQQPANRLRKDLQRAKIRNHDAEADYLRLSMESKSLNTALDRLQEEFNQRKAFHSAKIQDRLQFYRRRTEFMEFMSRQGDQKHIESMIKERENERKRLEHVLESAEAAEQLIESSKGQLDALQSYEKQTDKLSRAAHVSSIQQVIDYWTYLQSFTSDLQVKVDQGNTRVSSLRDEFTMLKKERMSVRLMSSGFDSGQYIRLQEIVQTKEDKVSAMQEKASNLWSESVIIEPKSAQVLNTVVESVNSLVDLLRLPHDPHSLRCDFAKSDLDRVHKLISDGVSGLHSICHDYAVTPILNFPEVQSDSDSELQGHGEEDIEVGRRFDTLENATEAFERYANASGFTVCKGNSKRDVYQELACSARGKVRIRKSNEGKKRNRGSIKQMCKCHIILRKVAGCWMITKRNLKHTHALMTGEELRKVAKHRFIPEDVRGKALEMYRKGETPAKIQFTFESTLQERCTWTMKDLYNMLYRHRFTSPHS